jgi:CRISPR-associated protein Csh1
MLNTLLKIGQWQSQGKSQWDRFLETSDYRPQERNENTLVTLIQHNKD